MILHPNCKINLGLRVTRKREDGYHDLETIFVPVYGLHDELEIKVLGCQASVAEGFIFEQEGITVDCPAEDNLIVKCYKQMTLKYPQIGNVFIRFKKQIPFGAGLGGGSSDAAHMAIALNEIFELGLSKAQLAEEVKSLGADCPFFIYNSPCYAEGIGDKLTPINMDLQGIRMVMIKPEEGVSTRDAYCGIIPTPNSSLKECALKGISSTEIIKHKELFINDFEKTVFPKHIIIAHIKKRLLDAGAFYASMSGSGSTVFGLFKDNAERCSFSQLRMLEQEFSSMILFNDTFGEWKS